MFSTNTSFLDLLYSFTPDPNSQPVLPNDDTFGTFDECNFQYNDNNSESKSDIEDESDDGSEVAAQSHFQGVMDFMNDVGDASDEEADDKVHINVWSQLENKIRLGMQFENRKQVKKGEERIDKNNVAIGDNIEKPTGTKTEMPAKEAEKEDEAEKEPNRKARKEEITEAPSYQPENEKRPFIIGTSFLTTAKAVIKFDKGTITLRSGKSNISFHRIPESLYKIERGVKNDIEPIAHTMTINRLVLEWKERIKLNLKGEMKFDQWKSKNSKSKHPALVKVEGEMDDEGEVT
nr:hypothetical protein [Tanacetum cinerariifolium]